MKKKIGLSDILLAIAVICLIVSLFGPYRPMIVLSGSMEPSIKKGSIIIGERVTKKTDLSIGDICTYIPEDASYTVTHRITDIKDGKYIFKGDHNEVADDIPVKREQIKYVIRFGRT